jgi:hypothetical protein
MIEIVKFRSAHLQWLELQEAQAYLSADIAKPENGFLVEQAGQAFTAMDGGQVLACAGVVEVWAGRAVAWAFLSKNAGRHMMAIHRAVAGYLLASKVKRIEAWVDEGFEPGMRWLEMLGFRQETPEPMRAFRPDGGSCFLFARVK